jgi:hypothetical protein
MLAKLHSITHICVCVWVGGWVGVIFVCVIFAGGQVECMLANLIHQGLVKGYIAHKQQVPMLLYPLRPSTLCGPPPPPPVHNPPSLTATGSPCNECPTAPMLGHPSHAIPPPQTPPARTPPTATAPPPASSPARAPPAAPRPSVSPLSSTPSTLYAPLPSTGGRW